MAGRYPHQDDIYNMKQGEFLNPYATVTLAKKEKVRKGSVNKAIIKFV